jgi:cold shock CspA family protein
VREGVVKSFDAKKGFGFILDENGQDVFVHFSVIEGDGFRRLRDGEKVEFESVDGPKGCNACKVRRVEPAGGGQIQEQPKGDKSPPQN